MKLLENTKLITKEQLKFLIENEICIIYNNYDDEYIWKYHISNSDINKILLNYDCSFAINTRDYYNIFGWDFYFDEINIYDTNHVEFMGLTIGLEKKYDVDDIWNVREYLSDYFNYIDILYTGSLLDCQNYIINWYKEFFSIMPLKINFIFPEIATPPHIFENDKLLFDRKEIFDIIYKDVLNEIDLDYIEGYAIHEGFITGVSVIFQKRDDLTLNIKIFGMNIDDLRIVYKLYNGVNVKPIKERTLNKNNYETT